MALARINGPMLQSTLERQGTNLSILSNVLLSSTPTVIFDVINNQFGVRTSSPQYTLDVNGNAQLGNIVIYNNTITSTTGKIALGSIANVTITGGTPDQIVYTDGAGNLAFGSLALLAGLEGFTANNIIVGTVTQSSDGFGTSALTSGMDVATAIYTLDNILGNISNISGNLITTGNLFLRGVTGYNTTNNILITDGAGNTSFVNANTLPAIVSINANTSSINANLVAFETWANATFVTTTTETELSANVGAYQTWANANIGTLYLGNISTQANLGTATNNISALQSNVGAYQTWANANISTLYLSNISTQANLGTATNNISALQANVGAFEIYANANIGILYLGNISTNANLGAYQTWANANIGTLYLDNISTNANLGAYQTYANANAATQATAISTINANIGAFETYANLYIGAAAYGNANVAAYLPTYTGNLSPGNVTSVFYGNVHTDYILSKDNRVVTFAISSAVGLPTGGNTARPSSPSQGQFRYNTDISAVEYYDGSGWVNLSSSVGSQYFYGDGVNATFTLNTATTAAGILVSINGTVQLAGVAYTVTGNQITFTEIPQDTDLIDIRFLAAATTNNFNDIVVNDTYIPVTTANTIVDSFDSTLYRSVKYIISGTKHMAEIQVLQNSGIVLVNPFGVLNTDSNTINYYANINGSTVNLLAQGTVSSNIRIQRTYFAI